MQGYIVDSIVNFQATYVFNCSKIYSCLWYRIIEEKYSSLEASTTDLMGKKGMNCESTTDVELI